MIKSKEIAKTLGITYLQYENCRDTHFGLWCNNQAMARAIPLRKLQTNDHLFNWYCDMWLKNVELPFYMQLQDYIQAGINDKEKFMDLFLQCAEELDKLYPKPILNIIIRQLKNPVQYE